MLLPSSVAGRTLDLRGPDLARRPEVARRWYKQMLKPLVLVKNIHNLPNNGSGQ